MKRIIARELAWAGGLFEGEGCFMWDSRRAQARISMTDEDSVRRFAFAVGIGNVTGPYDQGGKPFWVWSVQTFERVQAVGAMLWYGLGTRRRKRLAEVLEAENEKARSCSRSGRCRHAHYHLDGVR